MNKLTGLLLLPALIANTGLAGVTPEQAARLGQDLTPVGAERAGNEDGSIPPWDPAGTVIPKDFVPGSDHYIDPYREEQPLYTIDLGNWQDYAEILTEGSRGLLQKLGPSGFKINVYPTKRVAEAPDWVYRNAKENATRATLTADGQKIEGNLPGPPFPLPQSGLEALWNHMVRYAEPASQHYDVYYVGSNGKPILSTTGYSAATYPAFETPEELVGDKPWAKLRINYLAPARRAGEILLIHEPGADYTKGKGRKAWQYLTGQRRVRLAPAVAFDTPNPAVAGTATYDDAGIWNGSPERYTWVLAGKKEMIVPASNYQLLFEREVEDILGEKFIAPEYTRWEKHRVWIVEGTLKDGLRHLYKKRRIYINEDTWSAAAGETYDGSGKLWRVQFAYTAKLYDRKASAGASGSYDLIQGIYNLNGKPIPGKFSNGVDKGSKYFTPKGLARGGVR